jgi:hypothetical protein
VRGAIRIARHICQLRVFNAYIYRNTRAFFQESSYLTHHLSSARSALSRRGGREKGREPFLFAKARPCVLLAIVMVVRGLGFESTW